LSYCLGVANEKEGVSTNLFPHKNGTKEIIKVRLTKFTHRIDTASQFAHLQGVLGIPGRIPGITIGLCMPNPRVPELRAHDEFGFSSQRATIGDNFNLFCPSPMNRLMALPTNQNSMALTSYLTKPKRR
jgi:hypothetical protein